MATSDHFARGGCSNFWGRQFDRFFLVVLKDKKKPTWNRDEKIEECQSLSADPQQLRTDKLINWLFTVSLNENKRLFDSILKISKKIFEQLEHPNEKFSSSYY